MDPLEFNIYRDMFIQVMKDKNLAEIRAARMTFRKLNEMTSDQVKTMISDLEKMEIYKTRVHSVNEEWDRIEQSYYKS